MRNTAGSSREPDRRADNYLSVVTDLTSLIERIQASIRMLEPVIARASAPGELEAYDDVVVLDDVTPHYVRANTALDACRAKLGVALQGLLGSEASDGILETTAAQQARQMAHHSAR
jgi:hypothetical protein